LGILNKVKNELLKKANQNQAKVFAGFFKTGKGEYGEGEKFLGIKTFNQKEIVKKYSQTISLEEILTLLQKSKWHEEKTLALRFLVFKYKKGTEAERKKIFHLYLNNTEFINNWDLVDMTCQDIVGNYLFEKDRKILYKLAKSKNLWEKRIAIVSTLYFISKNQLDDTFKLAEILLFDKNDLIHKAVGWALREAGKKDEKKLLAFLNKYKLKIPRTTLRYAIEKLPEKTRKELMKK